MVKQLKNDIPIARTQVEEIIDLIKNKEDITLISLPRAGKTYFAAKFEETLELEKLLPRKVIDKNIFIVVDLNQDKEFLEESLHQNLNKYSNQTEIKYQIEELIKLGRNITFIVDNCSTDDIDLLIYILNLSHISIKNINYLFLIQASDFYGNIQLQKFSQIFRNILPFPYMNKSQALEWLNTELIELSVKLSDKEKDEVYELAGGIPSLLKHFVRLRHRLSSIKEIKDSMETKLKVEALWGMFNEKEKEILKNCFLLNFKQEELTEYKYLQDLNLLDKEGGVIGKWVGLLFDEKSRGLVSIKVHKNNIYWSGEIINEFLTKNEEKLMLYMTTSQKGRITRDEVAKVIWGNDSMAGISEYAIDQSVSRLRKKLDRIGIGGEIIKTLKGKGFCLDNVNII